MKTKSAGKDAINMRAMLWDNISLRPGDAPSGVVAFE